jgi:hypothetical protein
MRLAAWFIFITLAGATTPLHAQSPDDSLRIYAVNVVHSRSLRCRTTVNLPIRPQQARI